MKYAIGLAIAAVIFAGGFLAGYAYDTFTHSGIAGTAAKSGVTKQEGKVLVHPHHKWLIAAAEHRSSANSPNFLRTAPAIFDPEG